ncbi:hypothetical protein ANN_22258 [Periplaneta americana]|uniref:DUF4817 domain-containing protein n=1 Tax=Periplaneta americana TaxID=6978 RepID=A0ABQ8S8J1_PERAM|nr:hypothetical protein ANN_22258 [Periplaneta americana]
MSPGLPRICSYWVEGKPRKNLNQVTCPDRDSNPGHLVSQPDALTVTPQIDGDFFLWGYVKDRVYVSQMSRSLRDLQGQITRAVEIITLDMLDRVWQEFDYRLDMCRVNRATQRAYQREFGVRNPPKRNTILGLVNKLETTGSLVSEKGKHRSSRLPTVVVDVRARLEQSPKKSLPEPVATEISGFDNAGLLSMGYLKDRVYTTRPQTLDDLKHNITQEIQANNRVLQRVASNMERRVELCLMQGGGNFQHLL